MPRPDDQRNRATLGKVLIRIPKLHSNVDMIITKKPGERMLQKLMEQ